MSNVYKAPMIVSHNSFRFETGISGEGSDFPGLGLGVGGSPANSEGNYPGKGNWPPPGNGNDVGH